MKQLEQSNWKANTQSLGFFSVFLYCLILEYGCFVNSVINKAMFLKCQTSSLFSFSPNVHGYTYQDCISLTHFYFALFDSP